VRNRESLIRRLADENIGTGIHYPIPLHIQKAYEAFGYKLGDFPVAEKVAPEILSLPMFPELSADQQEHVAQVLLKFVSEHAESKVLATAANLE
jgi:dTDP-4-amino-4,6-dideoxygalactose transaminase